MTDTVVTTTGEVIYYDVDVVENHKLYCDDPECPILNPIKSLDSYKDSKQRAIGKDGGLKNDKDKPRWSLLPFDVIEGIVEILTYGAKKYKPDNWKKVETDRSFDAMMRHIRKWKDGEIYDKESGFHHLDHALCDLMFIVWNEKHKRVD